jgi:uncharacterized repeat protein (TIGR01451 family)
MKSLRKIAVSTAFAVSLVAPFGLGAVAHAAEIQVLSCATSNEVVSVDGPIPICDLAIDKQVSVNGGTYVEADTSADAAQAQVGDTVTWQITVTNNSSAGYNPGGFVYVKDDIPSGFNLTSSNPSVGTWGVYAPDVWSIPLSTDGSSNLPATLTFTTTATAAGLFDNTALFLRFDSFGCPDGGCAYHDGDPSNDSNDAWVDPSAKPVVLADSTTAPTLVNTGSGTAASVAAVGLIVATLAVGASSRFARKRTYGLN